MKNIIERLTAKLMHKGMKPDVAAKTAIAHLQKSGVLKKGTTQLTPLGRYHNAVPSALRPDEPKTAGGYNRPKKY